MKQMQRWDATPTPPMPDYLVVAAQRPATAPTDLRQQHREQRDAFQQDAAMIEREASCAVLFQHLDLSFLKAGQADDLVDLIAAGMDIAAEQARYSARESLAKEETGDERDGQSTSSVADEAARSSRSSSADSGPSPTRFPKLMLPNASTDAIGPVPHERDAAPVMQRSDSARSILTASGSRTGLRPQSSSMRRSASMRSANNAASASPQGPQPWWQSRHRAARLERRASQRSDESGASASRTGQLSQVTSAGSTSPRAQTKATSRRAGKSGNRPRAAIDLKAYDLETFDNDEDFDQGDFDEELERWVTEVTSDPFSMARQIATRGGLPQQQYAIVHRPMIQDLPRVYPGNTLLNPDPLPRLNTIARGRRSGIPVYHTPWYLPVEKWRFRMASSLLLDYGEDTESDEEDEAARLHHQGLEEQLARLHVSARYKWYAMKHRLREPHFLSKVTLPDKLMRKHLRAVQAMQRLRRARWAMHSQGSRASLKSVDSLDDDAMRTRSLHSDATSVGSATTRASTRASGRMKRSTSMNTLFSAASASTVDLFTEMDRHRTRRRPL